MANPAPSIEHDLDRALVDVGQLEHENTVLVEQWHDVAQEAEMWKARAESALRPLGESVDAIVRPLRRAHEDRDRALDACAERIAELLADVKAAAGSLGVPLDEMPPGSTLRRVAIANRLLIAARDRLLSRMVDWRRVAMRIWRSRDVVAADRDHWRRVAEIEIDGRHQALLEIAAVTEDRDAWQRSAERMRERADACELTLTAEIWRKR
jgi:type I site-specific restriction endonuclease